MAGVTKEQADLIIKQTTENANLLGNLNNQTLNLAEGIRDIKKQITHLEDKIDTVDKNSRAIDKDVTATNQNYIHLEKQFTSHIQENREFHEKLVKSIDDKVKNMDDKLDDKLKESEKEVLDKATSYTRSENLKSKNQSLIALVTAIIGGLGWVITLIAKIVPALTH